MRVSCIIPSYGKDFSKSARWYTKSRSRCFRHPEYFLTAVAVLEHAGHLVQFIDATTHNISKKSLVNRVMKHDPDMVIVFCTTPSIYSDIEHAKMIKQPQLAHNHRFRRPSTGSSKDSSTSNGPGGTWPEYAGSCCGGAGI